MLNTCVLTKSQHQSGRIYNEHFSPPKVRERDDETGEPLVRRADDQPESVKHRLVIYERSTAPILDYFKRRLGDKLHLIPCETSKEGYSKVKPILESIAARRR
jgi:adenylate kinase family enzyme